MDAQKLINIAIGEVELKVQFLTQRNINLACELEKTKDELIQVTKERDDLIETEKKRIEAFPKQG